MPTLADALAGARIRHPRVLRGALEAGLIVALWAAYSLSRLVAQTAMGPALTRAYEVLHLEHRLGIHWEPPLNRLFTHHADLGLIGAYWYATTHYVVTAAVLAWLYRLGPRAYLPARTTLVAATLLGLLAYLTVPTAPPRFLEGYVDVLSLHAADGWWSTDASAPRGLGGLTNQLAAFPSLHAGWALWVALSLHRHVASRVVRAAGWAYAATSAVVIVGTGNHWVLDVVVGWGVVLLGWAVARRLHPGSEPLRGRRPTGRAPCGPPQDRWSSTSGAGSR